MLEISRVGVAESDDEIDLSLELSIGGSYGKLEKLKHVGDSGKEGEKGIDAVAPTFGFSLPEAIVGDQVETERGSCSEVLESQRKREIQALRRQEARRKREEKLTKSAANSKGINSDAFCAGVANTNDKVWSEAQQLQARSRDREMRENDALLEDSVRKKDDIAKCITNANGKDSNFTFRNCATGSEDHGLGSKPALSFLQNVPVLQMQDPHPQLQRAQPKNGFVYPYMVPCRDPNVAKDENGAKRRNFFQLVPCAGFRPYPNGNGNGDLKHESGTGCDSEHEIGKCGNGIRQVMSSGSLERSSSALSDYRSSSGKGGSSSETGSHSSCYQANEKQFGASATNEKATQPESNASSGKDLGQGPAGAAEKSRSRWVAVTGNVKVASSSEAEEPSPLRPIDGAEGNFIPSLPRMPCVSTTGNGPNGKTITGFLCRYTKKEVSIVCVCHGSYFSPAEFVKHAGGADVTHPLRHITMIPSSFG